MVYSEGLASVEPWLYRQGLNVDSWYTFSHDNDLLAKALHNTVSPPHTLSPSSVFSGGSDPEMAVGGGGGAKRKRNCILTEGKAAITKQRRRSRPSKKPQTTFITTDPSNFRQMVQQVTGDTSSMLFTPVVKPEPHRFINTLSSITSAVPTLDTSAFLSSHHHENLVVVGHDYSGSDAVGLPSEKGNAKSGSAVEFDPYPTFPTLESWKVM